MRTGKLPLLDRIVFESPAVRVGAFRCPVGHPLFRNSGAIQNDIFVFPRRSVWLCYEGESPFLADPSVVTLYNRGQRCSRSPASAAGDLIRESAELSGGDPYLPVSRRKGSKRQTRPGSCGVLVPMLPIFLDSAVETHVSYGRIFNARGAGDGGAGETAGRSGRSS